MTGKRGPGNAATAYWRLQEVKRAAGRCKEWTASCTQRLVWGMTGRGLRDDGGRSSAACCGERPAVFREVKQQRALGVLRKSAGI